MSIHVSGLIAPSIILDITLFCLSGPLRERIRRYASEGHDVETASEMKCALDHDGGIRGVQTAVVKLHPIAVNLPKWQGIQSLNNFR